VVYFKTIQTDRQLVVLPGEAPAQRNIASTPSKTCTPSSSTERPLVIKPRETEVFFFSEWLNSPPDAAPQRGERLDESLELWIAGSDSNLVDMYVLECREERDH